MRSPTKIILRLEKTHTEELDFNGGKIYFDPTYRPEHNVVPFGYVHSAPIRNPKLDQHDFAFNVQDGDKLYFNYGVVGDKHNYLGDNLWVVDYYMALAVSKDGNLIPVGEHILIEPIIDEQKSETILIPEMSKKVKANRGIVVGSNDPSIPNGSEVMFNKVGMFENSIEGKTLYVMYNSNIFGIINRPNDKKRDEDC